MSPSLMMIVAGFENVRTVRHGDAEADGVGVGAAGVGVGVGVLGRARGWRCLCDRHGAIGLICSRYSRPGRSDPTHQQEALTASVTLFQLV